MSEDSFWVKKGGNITSAGIPIVVCAIGQANHRSYFGECFIFLSGLPDKIFYKKQFTIRDNAGFPGFGTNCEELARQEAENQAEWLLTKYLNGLRMDANHAPASSVFSLGATDKKEILLLWMRGDFNEEIEEMGKQTSSHSLRDFIYDVLLVPCIMRNEE